MNFFKYLHMKYLKFDNTFMNIWFSIPPFAKLIGGKPKLQSQQTDFKQSNVP
jgi:hypothetical protein